MARTPNSDRRCRCSFFTFLVNHSYTKRWPSERLEECHKVSAATWSYRACHSSFTSNNISKITTRLRVVNGRTYETDECHRRGGRGNAARWRTIAHLGAGQDDRDHDRDDRIAHVLLPSIDGMHALDYQNCVTAGTCPTLAALGNMGTEDDIALLWLTNPSDAPAAVGVLEANAAKAGIGEIFYGRSLETLFNRPGLPATGGDPRTPDTSCNSMTRTNNKRPAAGGTTKKSAA